MTHNSHAQKPPHHDSKTLPENSVQTQPPELTTLTESLRSALAREIDPNESVRWCGQPAPQAMLRRALAPAILGFVTLLAFGCIFTSLSISTWRELNGLEPLLATNGRPSYSAVYILGLMGIAALLTSIIVAHSPWRARAAARRTVYAVTTTRILELVLSSNAPDATTRTQAIEPGHPLHIQRTTRADSRGDILLYPRTNNQAQLTLVGVTNAREVERIIRTTFDPPGPRSPGSTL